MEIIVVSDTNILIDLIEAGVLEQFFLLPMKVHTTDIVISEVTVPEQKAQVRHWSRHDASQSKLYMGILNILGSLVNIIRECFRVLPFTFLNMETKIKLYPTDYWKYETRAYLNAYFHICDKEEGKTFEGWAEIRIYPIIRNKIVILMRTVDVQYNKQILKANPDKPWKSFYLVKYEVQRNVFGIESVEYRQNQGFFAIGKNINLFASTTPW